MRERLAEEYFVQRIENLVGEGVPDVFLVHRGSGGQHWLEMKALEKLPVRTGSKVFGAAGLRPAQIAWIWGRAMAGASIWLYVWCGGREWLVSGQFAREFNDWSLEQLNAKAILTGERLVVSQVLL